MADMEKFPEDFHAQHEQGVPADFHALYDQGFRAARGTLPEAPAARVESFRSHPWRQERSIRDRSPDWTASGPSGG